MAGGAAGLLPLEDHGHGGSLRGDQSARHLVCLNTVAWLRTGQVSTPRPSTMCRGAAWQCASSRAASPPM